MSEWTKEFRGALARLRLDPEKASAWKAGLTSGTLPFTARKLKELVYRTDRPSLEHETQCAVSEARRIIQNIAAIESAFPVGFGLMAKEIRSWSNPPPSS